MRVTEFLSLLKGVKPCGDGWQAYCPSHDDQRRSLHVSEGEDGRILAYCHAGCSVNNICQALRIELKDLFPQKPKVYEGGKSPVVATYDYRDANGKLLFQVCRTADKRFFQRRPDGKGCWINGLGGIKPVLYRLPEVLQAVERGETVFIPEGEKDVDNLARLGLAATTSPMGAGKWRKDYSDWLKDANVVILPDNDGPGRKHAQQVAKSLQEKAKLIKLLELPNLPEKGDVSDWLAAGGTKEELLQLVEDCPEWEPSKPARRGKTKKEEDECKTRQVSFFTIDNTLFEQICVGSNSTFLAFNTATGERKFAPFLKLEDEIIEPIKGEDVELGAVKLPSGVEEYGDTLTLLAEIEAHIHRYLDVSPNYLKFAAYYILLSWLYDRFHTLPYLRALGDTGCGKSRFLDVIGGLCYKPISASGCVTPAPIYRMLRKWQGTLVLDEADMKNSDEYNEVVTILNCGFERGRPVIRATKDNPDKVQILPVYGPKVFATRRRFRDAALEARCLTEIMEETSRDDIPPVLGKKFFDEQQKLRNKLLLFRVRNYFKIDPEAGAALNLGDIEPRLRQISEAFVSLFANEPKVLESYRQFIQAHQKELIEQRAATPTGRVVESLFNLIEYDTLETFETHETGERVLLISANDIARRIDMDYRTVGSILKGLGLRTKPVKVSGGVKRCIIYDENKLKIIKRRYILPGDDPEESEAVSKVATVSRVTVDSDKDGTDFLKEVQDPEAVTESERLFGD